MTTEEKKSGISRRDLIKKGAVAGAVIWTVPMIETVPAYAAVGSGCPPNGPLTLSGAAVIFTIGTSSTVYWSTFSQGGTVCDSTPSIPSDHNPVGPVSACNAYVQWDVDPLTGKPNGQLSYGASSTALAVPNTPPACYFTASSTGVNINAAGQLAGVQIKMVVFHNGSIPSGCTAYGSGGQNHWGIACGQSGVNCAGSYGCS